MHGKPSRPLSDYRALAELRYPVRLFITRADILRAHEDPAGAMSLLEAGSRKLIVTYRDETLHEAAKLLRNNIGRLRVVDGKDRRRVAGYLGRPGKQISLTLNFG